MNSSNATPWISHYKPKAQAFFRLFCFPYAGGGASIFRDWREILPVMNHLSAQFLLLAACKTTM